MYLHSKAKSSQIWVSAASASEIFAAVVKEYGTDVTILGEKSFGKWSVQSLRDYKDKSSLKLTIAKRLTGKNKSSIDKIGVHPDIKIIDNPRTPKDEVIEYISR